MSKKKQTTKRTAKPKEEQVINGLVFFHVPDVKTPICKTELEALGTYFPRFVHRGYLLALSAVNSATDIKAACRKYGIKSPDGKEYMLLIASATESANKYELESRRMTSVVKFRRPLIGGPGVEKLILAAQVVGRKTTLDYDWYVGRSLNEVLRIVDAMESEEKCSEGWVNE